MEFRAFEMPPHPEMAAAQTLLMRTAVAAFWQVPYERRLVRWGTRVHDDFMLPHYVWQNFTGALEELQVHGAGFGAALDPAWFAPHLAFRFPVIGEVAVHGTTLELRHALEPWHALGETAGGGGTVRYVDSSVERLQARVTGWEPERFTLACNGVAVPLRPTDVAGEYVAGVRFKAWQPYSALHPTITAQSPLVFDVLRPLERPLARRPDPLTSPTRVAAPTTGSRSTQTRRRHAGGPASCRSAIRRDRWSRRSAKRRPSCRGRWTSGVRLCRGVLTGPFTNGGCMLPPATMRVNISCICVDICGRVLNHSFSMASGAKCPTAWTACFSRLAMTAACIGFTSGSP